MRNDDEIRDWLRAAVPPWDDAELKSDLWPRMLRKMEEPPLTIGWFEAVLLGFVAAALVALPELVPLVLYHL